MNRITIAMLVASGTGVGLSNMWLPHLEAAAEEFDIATFERQAMWLANVVHECAGFTKMTEDLSYSAATLLRLWPCEPRRTWGFTPDEALRYAHQPDRIASRVYANRLGNGNEASGDGWKYRGRGPIGLTFHDNYLEFSQALGLGRELVDNPDKVASDPALGARIAGRFWQTRGCNELADIQDLEGARKRVNGGLNGIDDVRTRFERVWAQHG